GLGGIAAAVAGAKRAKRKHARILFLCQRLECRCTNRRRQNHFRELVGDDVPGGGVVERAVERQNAAERGHRVGGECALIGAAQVVAGSYAAGIGVFDDNAGRSFAESLGASQGGVGVGAVAGGQG